MTTPKWRVALTTVGDVDVSTVQIANDGDRHGFETMVFGGLLDQQCERYATKADAVAGHARWIAKVRAIDAECIHGAPAGVPS